VRMNVVVHLAVDQQEFALETVGNFDIGGSHIGVRVFSWIAEMCLAPRQLIKTLIVIAAERNADLVEIRVGAHRAHCCKAAAGGTENADPIQIHPRPRLGELAKCDDVIFEKPRLIEMTVRDIEKCSVAARCPSSIDRDDGKAQGCKRLRIVETFHLSEARLHSVGLRAWIGMIDDGIFAVRIEIVGMIENAVDVGLAVRRLQAKSLGRSPPGRAQFGNVRALKFKRRFIAPVAEREDRWILGR
jgi:hypothetical protein